MSGKRDYGQAFGSNPIEDEPSAHDSHTHIDDSASENTKVSLDQELLLDALENFEGGFLEAVQDEPDKKRVCVGTERNIHITNPDDDQLDDDHEAGDDKMGIEESHDDEFENGDNHTSDIVDSKTVGKDVTFESHDEDTENGENEEEKEKDESKEAGGEVEGRKEEELVGDDEDEEAEEEEKKEELKKEVNKGATLRCQTYRDLSKATKVKVVQALKQDPEHRKEIIEMINILEEKYTGKVDTSAWKVPGLHVKHPHLRSEFLPRIRGSEEKERRWMRSLADKAGMPPYLMRAWDEISQCQIKDPKVGFLSGGAANRLNSHYSRKLALTQHSNWGNRTKTAFISFTSSAKEIVEHRVPWFQARQMRKQLVKDYTRLTLINTRTRLANRKPILRMKDEMAHYDVRNKSGLLTHTQNSFYENEWILPFSCSPDEIVGTWAWRDIEKWMVEHGSAFEVWLSKVGESAVRAHEKARLKAVKARHEEEKTRSKQSVEAKASTLALGTETEKVILASERFDAPQGPAISTEVEEAKLPEDSGLEAPNAPKVPAEVEKVFNATGENGGLEKTVIWTS